MALNARERAMEILAMARRSTLGLLSDVPDDKLTHQPVAGGNHALWVMGHLACTDDMFTGMYDGGDKKLPEQYYKLFGMGSTPVNDTAAYPPIAEVRGNLESTRKRLIDAANAASDAVLAEPLPKDFEGFAPDKLNMLISLAWHEGLHAGQVTMVRRSIGLGPKMG